MKSVDPAMALPTADSLLAMGLGSGAGMIWASVCPVLFPASWRKPVALVGGTSMSVLLSTPFGWSLLLPTISLFGVIFGLSLLLPRLLGWLRKPGLPWVVTGIVGLLTAGGSYAFYEYTLQAEAERDQAQIDLIGRNPPLAPAEHIQATTDRGTKLELRTPIESRSAAEMETSEKNYLVGTGKYSGVIRTNAANDACNCHGWVFTAGQAWIAGTEVPKILEENGYRTVSVPQAGDLAIYRSFDGKVSHTAVVRYTSPNSPVLVEGKWGCLGVYIHRPDQCPYGNEFTYYRAPRGLHTLRGIQIPSTIPNS
jgi:hypothetical protein